MAAIKIPVGTGFQLIPEGNHIFRIYDVEYNEEFGKIDIHMVTAKGQKLTETYRLKNSQGEMVSGACNAFAYLAHVALKDFSLEEIDHKDLVGCFIEAEVKHTTVPSNKGDGDVTFQNLGNKRQADGWDEEPSARTKELFKDPDDFVAVDTDEDDLDLDDLLEGLED